MTNKEQEKKVEDFTVDELEVQFGRLMRSRLALDQQIAQVNQTLNVIEKELQDRAKDKE